MSEKLILFDVNDTLINTFETAFLRNDYCVRKLNAPPLNKSEFHNQFGRKTFEQLIIEWVGLEKYDSFLDIYNHSRFVHKYKSLLLELDHLTKLTEKGITLGIVSFTTNSQLTKKFTEANIPMDIFKHIHCSVNKENIGDFLNSKVLKKDIYLVGDSIEDYLLSKNMGINFYAVTTGRISKEKFLKKGCPSEKIFPSINEVVLCL
ncbi:HAD family hydrolase [Bacillus sp. CH_442]|uniref:HAD family hydrolase n=1 Tax=Bacillus sp. CH_442 TaxID=2978217 RepID=UPI0030F533A0|nr:HAD hydrolase-like protein [Bacillus thuringiensis]